MPVHALLATHRCAPLQIRGTRRGPRGFGALDLGVSRHFHLLSLRQPGISRLPLPTGGGPTLTCGRPSTTIPLIHGAVLSSPTRGSGGFRAAFSSVLSP
eukprot:8999197-Heterocapsa_arctica.AAC.1